MNVLDNRELSWLEFNRRVLEQAARTDVPLLERLRFAAIFENNLDEFFMVRAGTLINRSTDDDTALDPRTRLSPSEQLARIYRTVRQLTAREENILTRLAPELSAAGVRRVKYAELDPAQHAVADVFFDDRVRPALNVLSEAEGAFVAGGRLCAAGISEGGVLIAVCSADLPPLTALPCENGFAFILTEDILAARAGEIIGSDDTAVFALTRSADIDLDDLPLGEMPITDAVRQAVSLRSALPAVRLRVSGGSERLSALLGERFSLSQTQVFRCPPSVPLGTEYVSFAEEALSSRTELFYPAFSPRPKIGSVIEEVLDGDVLISCPYEDFSRFTALLDEAADDSRVTAVKITLYRTAKHSRVIEALCRAAANGKEVTVCVELKARFDERHNIECAERLQKAGCRVIFGLYGMKVHSKLCLITLRSEGELIKLTQIGTGNYNETTAAQYTDLMLLTADNDIAADAENVFDSLAGGHLPDGTFSLLVAPLGLKERVLSLIAEETSAAESGAAAYIGLKLNGLTDRDIIAALTKASQAGVRIELIVRGICCLRPGVAGLTDNIRVISVIGRFLEHARIYIFGSGRRQRVYISSADLMTRNTRRRVEAAAPVHDKALKKRVTDYFAAQLADGTAWEKLPDGSYRRVSDGKTGSQELFMAEQENLPAASAVHETPRTILEKSASPNVSEEAQNGAKEVSENQDGYEHHVDISASQEISAVRNNNAEDVSENQNSYDTSVDNSSILSVHDETAHDTQNSGNMSVLSDNLSANTEISTVSDKEPVLTPQTFKLNDMSENRDSNILPEVVSNEATVSADENDANEDMSENKDVTGAELPPAPAEPQKQGIFARIASFFRRLGRGG
ncbi:MAG: polyphosphate kinase 1 [Ruminococcus sp.]|nr:polyphosphate kinase 1 [Ruminococcus sp.]